MLPDGTKAKLAPYAASAVVLTVVGGIGFWARGAPADVPLKIEPLPAAKEETRAAVTTTYAPLTPRRLLVHVAGEVFRPGVYTFGPNDRVADALRLAGGATGNAASERLNLAATLRDGQKIVVPHRDAPPPPIEPATSGPEPVTQEGPLVSEPAALPEAGAEPASTEGEAEPEAATTPKATLAPGSIALNSATVDDLDKLPGVGVTTAHKILDERTRRGGFRALEDLLDIKGIGPAKFEKMRPYLTL